MWSILMLGIGIIIGISITLTYAVMRKPTSKLEPQSDEKHQRDRVALEAGSVAQAEHETPKVKEVIIRDDSLSKAGQAHLLTEMEREREQQRQRIDSMIQERLKHRKD